MSTRALGARVIIENQEQLSYLWRTHEIFHKHLPTIIQMMFRMKRGEAGEDEEAKRVYQKVVNQIKSSQNAIAKLEAIFKEKWKTGKLANFNAEAYQKIRPILEKLKQEIGDWLKPNNLDKWKAVFQKHPEIVSWRGKAKELNPILPGDQEKVEKVKARSEKKIKKSKKPSQKKQRTWQEMELSYFLKANPEIKALGKTMEEYSWAEDVIRTKPKGLLFDYEKEFEGIPSEFHRKIFEMAYQVISGHNELVKQWGKDHQQWLKDKAKWEEEHKDYLNIRPRFLAFEKEARGKITKRRRRWHVYLDWLKNNPDLAAWQGKPAVINPISPEGEKRIRKASPKRKATVWFEEFFKANPELDRLDKLHKDYQENFVRPWAKRKNPDGFRHRSTFTMPSTSKHPAWFVFKKGATYEELDLDKGTVKLLVPTSDEPNFEWIEYRFKSDPRLKEFHKEIEAINIGKDKYTYMFNDNQLGREGSPLVRPAEIKGIKLIFRPAESSGIPYLVFTCKVIDRPFTPKVKQVIKREKPEGLVTCAVDLGIHNLAVATIRQNGQILRTRVIWDEDPNPKKDDKLQPGPSLQHINCHKRKLRQLRRRRGRPIKGEESCIELQTHTTNMGEDRFKKGGRKLVNFALNMDGLKKDGQEIPMADILLIEHLKGFITSAERERGINTGLISWNRGNLVKWAKLLAKDAGLYVREISQYYTSQVCSKCGSRGRRYRIFRDEATKGVEVEFGEVKPLFGCPTDGCLLGVNADYNASVNIHKVFYDEFPAVGKVKDRVYSVNGNEVSLDEVEENIIRRLEDKGIIKRSHTEQE